MLIGAQKEVSLTPIHTRSNEYKLGLWVKDAATGVGTLSFYIPETGEFVALGHGIIDSDSENLLEIDYGELTTTNIISVAKGSSGNPGEVRGTVNDDTIGEIQKNSKFGIFGTMSDEENLVLDSKEEMEVALRTEIEIGEAEIITDVNGEKKSYSIQVEKIYLNDLDDNKSFVIKVTDEELINTTGGIIRGLSGSPIVQNGKLIGIVTNVLVSNPTLGFGVFADLVLENMEIY
ncbi:MAG: hypothetical protein HFJ45_01090 [Clostridia bacterium]|nr:hypothetical protein [Clostridia bacterium]